MKIAHLMTEDAKTEFGAIRYTTEHETLFHLTDSYGLGLAVQHDALWAFRQDYISTTSDPDLNGIEGRDHYNYKFILDGEALAADYGVMPVQGYIRVIGRSGQSYEDDEDEDEDDTLRPFQESEIGINTKTISPLRKYLRGVVILLDLSHKWGIYGLIGQNPETTSFFGRTKKETISAIEALTIMTDTWRVPLFFPTDGGFRKASDRERSQIRSILDAYRKVPPGKRLLVLRHLIDTWTIYDGHPGDRYAIDREAIDRRTVLPQIVRELNGYYTSRKIRDVDPAEVRKMFASWVSRLGYGHNALTLLVRMGDEYGFFHPLTAPVDFTSVLRPLIRGDVDDALDAMKHVAPSHRHVEWYEADRREGGPYGEHVATGMALDDE